MQITIVGTAAQVELIKAWLVKMGEFGAAGNSADVAASRAPYRVLELGGRAGEAALERALKAWERTHGNKVKIIASGQVQEESAENEADRPKDAGPPPAVRVAPPRVGPKAEEPKAKPEKAPTKANVTRSPWPITTDLLFVSQQAETSTVQKPAAQGNEPGEIIVQMTPQGVIISSSDLDALDEFEALLRAFAPGPGTKEFQIYYLQHCKAEVAHVLLVETLGGGANLNAQGGSVLGDLASGMFGNMGMMGALLGAAGGSSGATTSGSVSTASGTVSITPDPRLNALYVQATYRDHDTIRQLLQIIDVEAGPDAIQIQSRPRFIPVMHGKADEVATIIRQVYSGRLADSGGGGQRGGGGGSPQELFLQMALGGRGGGRGGGGNRNQANRGEEQKMTMGVDLKSNSLIVSAPDYLFSEIAELVRTLDVAAVPPDQTVRVASLKRVNGDALKSSLSSMLGTNATINRTSSLTTTTTALPPRTGAAGTTGAGQGNTGNAGGQNQGNNAGFRQMAEQFNQGGRGGFPGGGGFGGGFPGGGNFGGRGGGGFPGGGNFGGGRGGGGFPGGGNFGGGRGGGGGGFPGGGGGGGGGGRRGN